jgi:NAD(P)H-hydrate epimerase
MDETVQLVLAHDSSLISEYAADVFVDSLLGIGMKGPLRPPILQAVQMLNECTGYKIAVDVPSGVEADTGLIENYAFKADLTITFHKAKPGLLKASDYVGELFVGNVGIPHEAEHRVGPGDVFLAQNPRMPESHKGDFGRLLVIGGNETYTGAPALVALAALRTGVDITYVAAPHKTHTISQAYLQI